MLDHDLIQRTLSTALRTGGELAEIFVEDKASSNAIFDDGKVENLSSGRDRGAGIRVIVGDTTGFAHTADLSETGLAEAAEAAGAAARSGGGGVVEVALTRQEAPRPNDIAVLPEDVAKARKVDLLRRADATRPRRWIRHHPGDGPLRRQPAPDPHRQQRRPAHRGRPGAHAVHRDGGRLGRHRHADRLPVARPHRRLRAVRPATTSTTSPARRPIGPC